MDHNMILDTLSHPTRLSIPTFRTLLWTTILPSNCTLSAISFSSAAELFPFSPPSPSQQLTQFDFDAAIRRCDIRAGESPDRVADFPGLSVRSVGRNRAAHQLLDSAQVAWHQMMPGYQDAKMVLYREGTNTGCGYGQAAAGPFYCPNDE